MNAAARVRAALPVLVTAAAVAASAVLWHNLPEPTDVSGPFDVHGAMGEPVHGRALVVTVTGIRLSSRVEAPRRPPVAAAGEWVVVDAELQATAGFVLPVVDLQVGPNTYIRSERFRTTQLGGEVAPGITQRGSWVFDVAPSTLDAATQLQLRVWHGDGRLDSRVVVAIPLRDRHRPADLVALDPVERRG